MSAEHMISAETGELIKTTATIAGLLLASVGLLLNAFATLKTLRSRKLLNYQEIIKSHRELWKLTLDNPQRYERVLAPDPDLESTPITECERRFVNLVLLHSTSAFYFSKHSDVVEIQKLEEDIDDLMALPIPRAVWQQSSKYFNRDFVRLVEGRRGGALRRLLHMKPKACLTKRSLSWTILVLTAFPDRLGRIVEAPGDRPLFLDHGLEVTEEYLEANRVDFIICFGYARILKKHVLSRVPAINVHGGYLPHNQGPNPNLWAIVDDTPRGVTVHWIDAGVDTGDIIAQRMVPLRTDATFQSSFDQIVEECTTLLAETWPLIRSGRSSRSPQPPGGSRHRIIDQAPLSSLLNETGLSLPIEEFRARARTLLGRDQPPAEE